MSLKIVPLELREANELISRWHRHHKPVIGHRFSLGVLDTSRNVIVGAAIVGRPVSRNCPPKTTLEVTRLVTDGTKNACSCLYAAASRVGKELGYSKIQTYLLDSETGISLKAAGWTFEVLTKGGHWNRPEGTPRRSDQPECPKQRWAKILNTVPAYIV